MFVRARIKFFIQIPKNNVHVTSSVNFSQLFVILRIMGLTGYNVFVQEKFSKLKKRNKDMNFGDIGSKLGEQWKELTPAEQKKYEKKAAKLNEAEEKKKEPKKEPKQTKPKTAKAEKPSKPAKTKKSNEVNIVFKIKQK